ncbi:aryl-sulfate sulfotransferase [Bifidobacterium catenulatum subsp. kashiwanohense]|uniref:Aryl-sulfate sulfotransferase n=1 Tax=Bifidobacterium catenulatum subsp. kashiwanohense TaxID=630129 RepID=A0AAJ1PAT9_9BIFI|nr:aryl-sulfate sulfotransferase [Bifidobacterium catenulatum]MDH7871481.1 aryl-sulfate sulfotransferase [Bifidobacterium catenulatum subsp. kashiwanohense]KFI66423.1 putative lipoprotein [Bifidobacterium catenulatum subsp. kashiwanohense JCM 15439 = DSM 21854]MDH7882854.1 aryl-sulfate sulfotransferase [Bifidobacterium catenulatum subsp. kashiwanohense]MDH7886343.1 aryl-sulfate sulfotransferase [Bifidobacterium catenulatum subsp. kashiwanohense]MDH7888297.1 aryl-sulfate sulfotransferase [Bifid
MQLEQTVVADSGEDLGDGLYAILGNDSDEQDFMFYYDTHGVLRGEIPVLYYRSHRLLFDDDGLMWFSASTHHMAAMNRLGKLEKIYDPGSDYILHHDYAMDANGDIVLLATEMGRDDNAVQDQVIKLSTSTGSVTRLADFGELFAGYKASTTHAGTDVPYSPYVSSAQELDNGQILIDSGMKGLFGQYNEYGDLLAQFKMTLNSAYIYRVYKYNFSGFYFD